MLWLLGAGTFFWHDHASGNRADGLSGLLIIDPEDGTLVCTHWPTAWRYHGLPW